MAHQAVSGNTYTRGIAEFVSGLRYEAIPAGVLARIKLLILDSLGCAIYGAGLEWSRILQRQLGTVDSTAACTVWGTRLKLSAPHAALINGTQVQGFELDDMHHQGLMHTGSVVLPALVSVTETGPRMSGRDFLTAAVAGYEVGPRVGICMNPQHIMQGWHSDATCGTFAAAAGAARGLGLDAGKTVHALGIAGTQAAGLMASQYGSMVKRMHAGRAAQSGLYAAHLAANGYTGIVNVFESEYGGFCTTFSRSQDLFKLQELVAGFGSVWQTLGISLKFYSCIGSAHTTLDAIRDLRQQRPFGANDVEKITVHGSRITVDKVGWKYVPQGLTSAQLNLSYCVATLLLEGDCFVDQFTQAGLTDPDRMALAQKVSTLHDPEITARGPDFRWMVRVEIRLKDGTRMERTLQVPRHHAKFASEREVVEKFEKLAMCVMPGAQARRLCNAVLGLDKLVDASEIARLLAIY